MKRLPRVTLDWVYDSGLRGCAPMAIPLAGWIVLLAVRKGLEVSFNSVITMAVIVLSSLAIVVIMAGARRSRWWPTWKEFVTTALALVMTGAVALGSVWAAAIAGATQPLLVAMGVTWLGWLLVGDLVIPARGPARLYLWLYEDMLRGELPPWAREDPPYGQ